MVISDKHRYLFIEVPRTGTTAISKELCEMYDGYEILHKHANYKEFLRFAKPKQRDFFVFAGVRDPLDDIASLYSKFLTNHKSQFTDTSLRLENGGWVSQKRIDMYEYVQKHKDFDKYLRKYHKLPYTSNSNVNKKYCDFFIRFENLDEDFGDALALAGVKKKRKLPLVNKTKGKKSYFNNNTDKNVARTFGPFMQEWGYELPAEINPQQIKWIDLLMYEITKTARKFYMNNIKSGAFKNLVFIRDRVE